MTIFSSGPQRRAIRGLRTVTMAGVAAGVLAAGNAFGADLVQHRAAYSMFLSKSDGTAALTGARGAMIYSFTDTCDGWNVDTKVYLRLQYAGGPEVENVRTMTTWEAKDGSGFRFRISETGGDEKIGEIKGAAVAEADNGIAEYTAPRAFTVDLPAKTLFPTGHLEALIDTALAGTAHLGRVLFDGTSLDNPFIVSALIHPLKTEDGAPRKWRARLAYFPVREKKETPDFELIVDYDQEGVVYRAVQDYGDYTIEARLDRIEKLPPATCQ